MGEVKLMKGNEVIAEAAIRCGADGYFGYPITPQSEVLETLAEQKPWETTGMVVLQAESEVSAINMVYGASGTGHRVMTSSSGPGISLMQEGFTFLQGIGSERIVHQIGLSNHDLLSGRAIHHERKECDTILVPL